MPSVVKIDPRRKIVLSTFYGDITGKDVLRHRATIASVSAFSPDYVDVVDFTSVTSPVIDESALTTLANQGSLFHIDTLHVIIVPEDTDYQTALRYKEMAARTRLNIQVVRSMDAARELLKSMGHRL